jgi:hypothetical protein
MASLFLLYVVHMALFIINVASGFNHGNINRAPVLTHCFTKATPSIVIFAQVTMSCVLTSYYILVVPSKKDRFLKIMQMSIIIGM